MSIPNCKRGLGLCLSGGGFRASFYHIGVLIQMAELGLLRHVEVISTVSGGSIVGAAYYLKLKTLLENKQDQNIYDSDFIKLAHELEQEFLEAVQENLRMHMFADFRKNIKMVRPKYSRSDAMAELYEDYIYKNYLKPEGKWISMRELVIKPGGQDIHPCDTEQGNQKRINKIPVIIFNATSLNSGHNWYFSSRSMGEVPPRNLVFKDIDKRDRYRRIRYDDIKGDKRNFPLGSAVAASAGVPGVFPPMSVSDMYPGHRVQLVDGGVFDNQGVSGALDPLHTCKYLVVSDASGQSDAVDNPDPSVVNVLGLTNSIMMGRIREEIINGLYDSTHNSQNHTKNVAYFHLTRGLFAKNINAINQDISDESDQAQRENIESSLSDYGVHEDMQNALAHIRTDLDSFTDVEAGCLIADGFLMSRKSLEELKQAIPDNAAHEGSEEDNPGNWIYTKYIERLKNNDPVVLKHLQIAKNKFFKPFLHMFGCTLNVVKSMGLILASLPLLILLIATLWGVNELMARYLDYSLVQILCNVDTFTAFITDLSPAIFGLIYIKILSTIADKFIEGSQKYINWARKLMKLPMTILTAFFVYFVFPIVSAIFVNLYLATIDKYYIKTIGKLN